MLLKASCLTVPQLDLNLTGTTIRHYCLQDTSFQFTTSLHLVTAYIHLI